ncbi:MAG: hypothetical protein ACKO85_06975, partial [Isosphaeraceae bacterium]
MNHTAKRTVFGAISALQNGIYTKNQKHQDCKGCFETHPEILSLLSLNLDLSSSLLSAFHTKHLINKHRHLIVFADESKFATYKKSSIRAKIPRGSMVFLFVIQVITMISGISQQNHAADWSEENRQINEFRNQPRISDNKAFEDLFSKRFGTRFEISQNPQNELQIP